MIIDLIEVKPKINKFKVFMCILVILLLLCIPIMFIIKDYQNKKLYNGVEEEIALENEENINENEQQLQDKVNENGQVLKEEIPNVTLTQNRNSKYKKYLFIRRKKRISYI